MVQLLERQLSGVGTLIGLNCEGKLKLSDICVLMTRVIMKSINQNGTRLESEQPRHRRNYYILTSLKAWNRTHTHTDSYHAAFIRSKRNSDVYIKGH